MRSVFLLLLIASVSHAEPSEKPWLLGRTGDLSSVVQQAPPALLQPAIDCGIELTQGTLSAEFAVTQSALAGTLHGKVDTQKLACVLGLSPRADGSIEFQGITIKDVPGGVAFSRALPPPGAWRSTKAEVRFLKRNPLAQLAVVADVPNAHFLLEYTINPAASIMTLYFERDADARALDRWVRESIAASGDATLNAITSVRTGRTVALTRSTVSFGDSVAISRVFRAKLLEAFRIPSGSMLPTLLIGDHTIVAKGVLAGTARRGDVVVFQSPLGPQMFAKRVVAVGGDHLLIQGNKLILNGQPVPTVRTGNYQYEYDDDKRGHINETLERWQEQLDGHRYYTLHSPGPAPADVDIVVPPGHIYVLGDNRDNSYDSRQFGTVPVASVTGRLAIVWWSPAHMDRIGQQIE
jgi:signal peptidase I